MASVYRSARDVSNPFDSDDDEAPRVTSSSKVHSGKKSASSSSRYTNPFDEDDGPVHRAVKPSRADSSNPFSDDDDEPVHAVKRVTNGHKSTPSKSSHSSGSFDDYEDVSSKPKSRGDSILDDGSLFEDDEGTVKPSKESSSSRGFTSKLKAGGRKMVEGGARMRESASNSLSSVKLPSMPSLPSMGEESRKGKSKQETMRQETRDLFGEPELSYKSAEQSYSSQDQSRFADRSVEELQQYAVGKSQETTSSIKQCVRIAEDTVGVATKTMETLHEQGDQIRRTHETALHMDTELSRGEKLLGSLGGVFSRTWKPKKGRPITGPQADPEQYRRRRPERAELLGSKDEERRRTPNLSGLSGAQAQLEMEKEKQDDALSDLSNVLGRLKDMSMDMGSEIERQNGHLDRMGDDVDELNNRVKGASTRTRRLVGR